MDRREHVPHLRLSSPAGQTNIAQGPPWSLSYGQISPTPSGSKALSRSSERGNPCCLLLVLWVVLVWDLKKGKKKKRERYCMHRGACSFPSGTSYWFGVFIFQLTICLLRERSGHPTFKFRNHFLFDCYLHPLHKFFGEEVLLVLGTGDSN